MRLLVLCTSDFMGIIWLAVTPKKSPVGNGGSGATPRVHTVPHGIDLLTVELRCGGVKSGGSRAYYGLAASEAWEGSTIRGS